MPQIAQQDYLRVEISDLANLTEEEVQKINELHNRGTLMDALIVTEDSFCKILVDSIDYNDSITLVAPGGSLVGIDCAL